MNRQPEKFVVFLSGTRRDLKPYFAEAAARVNAHEKYSASSMDDSAPEGVPIDRWSRREAIRPDALVGLIGHYYGFVPEGDTKSLTEQEYEMATRVGIEPLMFLTDAGDPSVVDGQDRLAKERIAAFRARIKRECTRDIVNDPAVFAVKVMHALDEWEKRTLGGATQGFEGFYAPFLQPDFALGHDEPLVGQSASLGAIGDFAASDKRLLVVEAPWGRGKSRLILRMTGGLGWRS